MIYIPQNQNIFWMKLNLIFFRVISCPHSYLFAVFYSFILSTSFSALIWIKQYMFPIYSHSLFAYFYSCVIIIFLALSHYSSTAKWFSSGSKSCKIVSPICVYIFTPFYPLWRSHASKREEKYSAYFWYCNTTVTSHESNTNFLFIESNIFPLQKTFDLGKGLLLCTFMYYVIPLHSGLNVFQLYHSNTVMKMSSMWFHPNIYIHLY